jgi:DNA-3-methyladenine glycosylase II
VDQKKLTHHLKQLAKLDSDLAQAIDRYGAPAPRQRPEGFETFLSTIVSQQISTAAANTIMNRVRATLTSLTPEGLDQVTDAALRAAGLSTRKIEYARGLALASQTGALSIDQLSSLEDAQVIEHITRLRGFGAWSAEIYCMFSLGRHDIFPAGDLALQIALGRLKGLEIKPTPKEARVMTQHWQPYRTAGALFLWHYYHGIPNV